MSTNLSAAAVAAADTRPERTYLLAPYAGARPGAPQWFLDLLATPGENRTDFVEGAPIVSRRWGEAGKRGLILLHGGVAHHGWWDAIAPTFADDWTIVCPTLSGMGASGHREAYDIEQYVREVEVVAQAHGLFDHPQAPILVGHSFGGFTALLAAARIGARLGGAVIVDTPVRPPKEEGRSEPRRRGGRAYPTEAAALARFRLLPDQPCDNPWLVDHIARANVRESENGWGWRHDPDLWPKLKRLRGDPLALLGQIACPLAFVRGAWSDLVTDDVWALMRAVFQTSPAAEIPAARHHVMLDQPVATAAVLAGLLAAWPHRSDDR